MSSAFRSCKLTGSYLKLLEDLQIGSDFNCSASDNILLFSVPFVCRLGSVVLFDIAGDITVVLWTRRQLVFRLRLAGGSTVFAFRCGPGGAAL